MSPNSTLDLSTFEGRRAMWAAEMLSGKFVPYTGGGLRADESTTDGKPQCCCLGVAQELILTVAPRVLHRGKAPSFGGGRSDTYISVGEPGDSSSGWLTAAAATWYGLSAPAPEAAVDQQFIDELDAFNRERQETHRTPIYIHHVNDGHVASVGFKGDLEIGDKISLASMNDAGIPWSLIAGLITRERITGAKTGPVDA